MDLHFHFIKFYINFLILCSIIQKINSVLSFIYPQATTLSNDNILVIEQNGIYICDSTFNTIVKTLHTFSPMLHPCYQPSNTLTNYLELH